MALCSDCIYMQVGFRDANDECFYFCYRHHRFHLPESITCKDFKDKHYPKLQGRGSTKNFTYMLT